MDIYVITGYLLQLYGLFLAIKFMAGPQIKTLYLKARQYPALQDAKKAFGGKRVGVVFQKNNGSSTDVEPAVIKALRRLGVLCAPIDRNYITDCSKKGVNPFEDSRLAGYSMVITGTVIESYEEFGARSLILSDKFIEWASVHYPKCLKKDRKNKFSIVPENTGKGTEVVKSADLIYKEFEDGTNEKVFRIKYANSFNEIKCDYRVTGPSGFSAGIASGTYKGASSRQEAVDAIAETIVSTLIDEGPAALNGDHSLFGSNGEYLIESRQSQLTD